MVCTYFISEKMKRIKEIKKFLEVEELNKLEQGAVQGGVGEFRRDGKTAPFEKSPKQQRKIDD